MKEYQSVDRAAVQAGEVLRSKKASRDQKKAAVKVLGQAVAGEITKKVATDIKREAKKVLRKPETKAALKTAAKDYGVPLAKATAVGAAIAGTLAIGGAQLTRQRKNEAVRWANQQLAITRKKLPQLTSEQANALWRQYYDHALKQPVQNPFVGK